MPPPPSELTQNAALRVQSREHSVLRVPQQLADERGSFGPALLPFTPWHHFILTGVENALLGSGRAPTWADILQALWVCSPGFRQCSMWNKAAFAFRWNSLRNKRQAARYLAALETYFALAFIDRPPGEAKSARVVPRASLPDEPLALVRLEALCRRELGYSREEFWHTPYGHTLQLLSTVHAIKNPDAVRFDESSRQVREHLAARRRAARNSQPAPRF